MQKNTYTPQPSGASIQEKIHYSQINCVVIFHYSVYYHSMQFIQTILPYTQVVLSIFLIAAILLQTRGSSVGGAFGGSDEGSTFYTRRGAEKTVFQFTIVLSILFVVTAFLTFYLH